MHLIINDVGLNPAPEVGELDLGHRYVPFKDLDVKSTQERKPPVEKSRQGQEVIGHQENSHSNKKKTADNGDHPKVSAELLIPLQKTVQAPGSQEKGQGKSRRVDCQERNAGRDRTSTGSIEEDRSENRTDTGSPSSSGRTQGERKETIPAIKAIEKDTLSILTPAGNDHGRSRLF